MKPRRLLLVTWHDAWTHPDAGWKPVEQIEQMAPAVARTVGWEMRRTKRHLILAASLMEDQADGEVLIPLGMIVREDELAVKK